MHICPECGAPCKCYDEPCSHCDVDADDDFFPDEDEPYLDDSIEPELA